MPAGKGSGDYRCAEVFEYDLRNSGVLAKRLTESVEAATDCSIVDGRFFCYQENRTQFRLSLFDVVYHRLTDGKRTDIRFANAKLNLHL